MISFFTEQTLAPDTEVRLDADAVGHARARRAGAGDATRLLDGQGTIAHGSILAVDKRAVVARIETIERRPKPVPLDLLVPVADKDRMLIAAEKCAELQVTAWRPVLYARSRSVTPRGEGVRFQEKVVARMRAALEQSGGAWLPAVHPDQDFEGAMQAVSGAAVRLLLDSRGTSIAEHIAMTHLALAIGPEGGLEPSEIVAAERLAWRRAALASTTLRFETAIMAGAAVVRALQHGRT